MNDAKITSTLKYLGVRVHYKGYEYITRAIKMTLDNNCIMPAITKIIYPTIAKEFNTNTHSVERCMRHAIERAFEAADTSTLHKVFGNTISATGSKATVGQFIATVAEYIRLESSYNAINMVVS